MTDIDAVGERGGTVLLVSCKGLPYSSAWDRGEYNVVRNAASNVASAVEAWASVIEDIKTSPVGDNFDFSGYRRVVGVVVYPRTPWVAQRRLTSEVSSGLYQAASAMELVAWCRRAKG